MKNTNCSLCLSAVDVETAEILTMGAYGTPKLLCNDCTRLMHKVTRADNYPEVKEAIEELGNKISVANIDDRRVLDTVSEIFKESLVRAEKIKAGTYDFELDKVESTDTIDEIPEELLETEEDKALDEKEAKVIKKWDKIMNYVSLGVLLAVVGFLLYYFLS